MRTLIVEDDYTSRILLENVLKDFRSFRRALDESRPYDLICMDIMMPKLSGQDALRQIRHIEKKMGVPAGDEVKVFMTTALSEAKEVIDALYNGGASAYFVKPINMENFIKELKSAGLIQKS